MWFSSGGTNSVVHTDSVDNLNCVYAGEKNFVMIDHKKYADMVTVQPFLIPEYLSSLFRWLGNTDINKSTFI